MKPARGLGRGKTARGWAEAGSKGRDGDGRETQHSDRFKLHILA